VITLDGPLKFVHVAAAAVWLGSNAMTVALRAPAIRSRDVPRAVLLVRETDRVQLALVPPAVLLLLVAGICLVLEGGWGFDRFFVVFGRADVLSSLRS